MHQSKSSGFVEEIAQKDADAIVGPVPVHQQQPEEEAELCQSEISILHRLTSLHAAKTHANMCRW